MRKLIRRGECNHCGACCNGKVCGHHDPVGMRCLVWRTPEQPTKCREFPAHPQNISQHIECSIRFYDAETGQEITKKKRRRPDGRWECDWDELNSYEPLKGDYP